MNISEKVQKIPHMGRAILVPAELLHVIRQTGRKGLKNPKWKWMIVYTLK